MPETMTATASSKNGSAQNEYASTAISLTPLRIDVIEVEIDGITPLIVHRWSEKSKKAMADAQSKATRTRKEPKNPEQEYEAARYRLETPVDGCADGVPGVSFKASIVGAARHFEGLTLVGLKQSLFVEGYGVDQLVPIRGTPVMRQDTVRVGMGTADLRYRPMYSPWSATLRIRYVASAITRESVLALVDAAGLGGIGEWRPSAPKSLTGSYGRFGVRTGQ